MENNNTFILDGDQRISQSVIAVAATEFEREYLKSQTQDRLKWVDDPAPLVCEVSKLGEHSLLYRLDWATIDNKLVLFYQSASDVSSKPSILAWLNLQGVKKFTDAMRFHLVIMEVTNGAGLPA